LLDNNRLNRRRHARHGHTPWPRIVVKWITTAKTNLIGLYVQTRLHTEEPKINRSKVTTPLMIILKNWKLPSEVSDMVSTAQIRKWVCPS
jgi:hypothetical protein